MEFQNVIVGAGFAGSVLAERIATVLNEKVLLIEQRSHIAGNAYDRIDPHGILVHVYGPHIFHTSDVKVWNYLSRFTGWNIYQHEVLGFVDGKKIPIPFNLNSLHMLFPEIIAERIEEKLTKIYGYGKKVNILDLKQAPDEDLKFLADFVYEKVFLNYTTKQWGHKPEQISPRVTGRVPIFVSRDNRYFQDPYQAMPAGGFTPLFEKMLDHPYIQVLLNTNYKDVIGDIKRERLIYTGMIDAFFDYRYGPLPYRGLDFVFENHVMEYFQEGAVVNYPNDYDYTRITEMKRITGQHASTTTTIKEFPKSYQVGPGKEMPYYPIPRDENQALYEKYRTEEQNLSNVYFAGRLAEYRYMNMDQVTASALDLFDRISSKS
jgi:UDP-galactopyranose mutase